MWFDEKDIFFHDKIFLDNLHGYILPHAGTKYTGNIISHTLRFCPNKSFKNILIIYLPSQESPNIGNKYYHEYYVPYKCIDMFYPNKKIIGYNILKDKPNKLKGLNKSNTLIIVSVDFSHFLEYGESLEKDKCAANCIEFKDFTNPCSDYIDDSRSVKFLNKLFPRINYQWIGRSRSPGNKGVSYLSFLLRDKPTTKNKIPDGFFVTSYDDNLNSRECLGNTNSWTPKLEKDLIKRVLYLSRTTSRLTGGEYLEIPVKKYTITYLYNTDSTKFIRGYHAIMSSALYLPSVFLENTYESGKWINSSDGEWDNIPSSNGNFNLDETLQRLGKKGGLFERNYKLFTTEVLHEKIIKKKKRKHRTRKRSK